MFEIDPANLSPITCITLISLKSHYQQLLVVTINKMKKLGIYLLLYRK